MVTITWESESAKIIFEKMVNCLLSLIWLSSGSSEMEGSDKVYFSTEKPTIYRKT